MDDLVAPEARRGLPRPAGRWGDTDGRGGLSVGRPCYRAPAPQNRPRPGDQANRRIVGWGGWSPRRAALSAASWSGSTGLNSVREGSTGPTASKSWWLRWDVLSVGCGRLSVISWHRSGDNEPRPRRWSAAAQGLAPDAIRAGIKRTSRSHLVELAQTPRPDVEPLRGPADIDAERLGGSELLKGAPGQHAQVTGRRRSARADRGRPGARKSVACQSETSMRTPNQEVPSGRPRSGRDRGGVRWWTGSEPTLDPPPKERPCLP